MAEKCIKVDRPVNLAFETINVPICVLVCQGVAF